LTGRRCCNLGKRLVGLARSGWRRLLVFFAPLINTVKLFLQTRGFDHAAAISFYFILSLAPLTILFFSAMGYIAAGLDPDPAAVDILINRITHATNTFVPVEGDTVRGIMDYLISRRGRFSIIGMAVLVVGASAVFGALENATSDIFRDGKRRKYLFSRLLFTVVLFALGLLAFLFYNALTLVDSFVVGQFGSAVDTVIARIAPLRMIFDWLAVPIGFLAVLYLPGIARPAFKHALLGAGMFFVLWTAARFAYSYWVGSFAQYNLLYGSLATPILLILWLFYSALILIFCLCFTAVASGVRTD